MLTAISESENNVSVAVALMHGGLERAAGRHGRRDAIRVDDDQWSFQDLDGWSNAFARHLDARGIGPAHRVAVMTGNRVEFLVVVEALSRLGAAAVLLSPAWKATEVGHALAVTGARHGVARVGDGAAAGRPSGRRRGHRSRRPGDRRGRRCSLP